jgi:hypothetical protein
MQTTLIVKAAAGFCKGKKIGICRVIETGNRKN